MPEESGTPFPDAPETPEAFKWIPFAWHHTRKNREALMQPAVWLVVALFAYGAYRLGASGSEEVVKVKDERIGFLNDQVAAYKDRLQGATPDQAAKRVEELRRALMDAKSKLDRLSPDTFRNVSEAQKAKLLAHASELRLIGDVIINADALGDSLRFASQIGTALQHAGAEVHSFPWTCDDDSFGLFLLVDDPTNPLAKAVKFRDIMNDASFHVGLKKSDISISGLGIDYVLFVCKQKD